MRVLISGTGGVVGTALLSALRDRLPPSVKRAGLFRSPQSQAAFARRHPGLAEQIQSVACDLTDPGQVQQAAEHLPQVPRQIAVHAAADVSWAKSADALSAINVEGTRQFAELARRTAAHTQMIYVSSAYAALDAPHHRNGYEQTKAQADRLLRDRYADLSPITFSCSLVVGRSDTGEISAYHGFYPLLLFLERWSPPFLVAHPHTRIDLVPCDWVADELAALVVRAMRAELLSDVVASAGAEGLPLGPLLKLIRPALNARRRRDGIALLPEVSVIPFRRWRFLKRSMKAWHIQGVSDTMLRTLDRLLQRYGPYLDGAEALAPHNVQRTPLPPDRWIEPVVRWWLDQHPQRQRSHWSSSASP